MKHETRAPTDFRVLGQRYTVAFVKGLKDKKHGKLLGRTHLDHGRVELDPEAANDKRVETYLHEVLHVVFHTARVLRPKGTTEEDMITALAPALVHTLRDNPDMVGYLMKGDTDD